MKALPLRIVSFACLVYFLLFFVCTDYQEQKCAPSIIDNLTAFDAFIAKLNEQHSQHEDIQNVMNQLKEKFREIHQENSNLRKEIKRFESAQTKKSLVEEAIIKDDLLPDNNHFVFDNEPSVEEEMVKKRIRDDAAELLYSFEEQTKNLDGLNNKRKAIELLTKQQIGMLVDIEKLISFNDDWRKKDAESLQKLVQRRIAYAQNPPSCSLARKLICSMNKRCGFGCQIHHLTYCLMIAFGTRRTLILDSKGWVFDHGGWEKVFLPLSNSCSDHTSLLPALWNGEQTSGTLEVRLPGADGIKPPPEHVPLSVPQDIAPRIKRIHGNPGAWWVGQFVKFIFRPQDWLKTTLNDYESQVNFDQPIVGVHIRRTDKLRKEASLHEVDEYMKHVDAWYDKFDMKHHANTGKKVNRRVYLATDEPTVIQEAREKYTEYEIINFEAFAKSAVNPKYRSSRESLVGIVADIYLLSLCNYIVCTFSSQVCRVSYELMQTYHPDAANAFHSLDDIYYFGGMTDHLQRALYDHVPEPNSEEIELKAGDIVGVLGNHWNGYSKGVNKRTSQKGLYPSWKVEEVIGEIKYPTYPGANKNT